MSRETGVVKWFSIEKGYGFIRRDQAEDVFVHHTAIEGEGFKTLRQGERVEFEVTNGARGPKASSVFRAGSRGETDGRPSAAEPTASSVARTGEGNGLRSLASQIRERLARRFLGLGR